MSDKPDIWTAEELSDLQRQLEQEGPELSWQVWQDPTGENPYIVEQDDLLIRARGSGVVVISATGAELLSDTSLDFIRATVDQVRRTIVEMYDARADSRVE